MKKKTQIIKIKFFLRSLFIMTIDLQWFSIFFLLNTNVISENSKNLKDTLALSTNYYNMKVPSLSTLPEESKRLIYRDIKNQIECESRRRLARSRGINLPRSPSIYLEPPPMNQNYHYEKFVDNKRKKIQVITTTPKSSSEEESREEEIRPNYVRDHAPVEEQKESETKETSEKEEKEKEEEESTDSTRKERIDFHIHGHEGPDTYVFGYDTGNGDNRQFRFEERHGNGTVTGQYGYYDTRGKLRKMYYTANPIDGYESFPINASKDD